MPPQVVAPAAADAVDASVNAALPASPVQPAKPAEALPSDATLPAGRTSVSARFKGRFSSRQLAAALLAVPDDEGATAPSAAVLPLPPVTESGALH